MSKGKKENRTTHPQKTHPGGGASASRLKDWSNRRPSYEGILSLLSLPTLNSLLTAIDQWGAGWGLLFWKAEACGLLVFLWHLAEYPLAVFGLIVTAGSYFAFASPLDSIARVLLDVREHFSLVDLSAPPEVESSIRGSGAALACSYG